MVAGWLLSWDQGAARLQMYNVARYVIVNLLFFFPPRHE